MVRPFTARTGIRVIRENPNPLGKLRAMVYYPMSNGRSIEEFVRLLTALQASDANGVATPENWRPGQPAIVPPPKAAEAAEARASEGYVYTDWYFSTRDLPDAPKAA